MIEYGKVYVTDPEVLDKKIQEMQESRNSFIYTHYHMPDVMNFLLLVAGTGRALRENLKFRTRRKIKSCNISFMRGQWDHSHNNVIVKLISERLLYQELQCSFYYMLMDELNVGKINIDEEPWPEVEIQPKIDFKKLGPKLGKDLKSYQNLINSMTQVELKELKKEMECNHRLHFNDHQIVEEELQFLTKRQSLQDNEIYIDENVKFSYDIELTPDVISNTYLRETMAAISQTRKNQKFTYDDKLYISVKTKDRQFYEEISSQKVLIDKETNSNIICELMNDSYDDSLLNEFADLGSGLITKFSVTILHGEKQ